MNCGVPRGNDTVVLACGVGHIRYFVEHPTTGCRAVTATLVRPAHPLLQNVQSSSLSSAFQNKSGTPQAPKWPRLNTTSNLMTIMDELYMDEAHRQMRRQKTTKPLGGFDCIDVDNLKADCVGDSKQQAMTPPSVGTHGLGQLYDFAPSVGGLDFGSRFDGSDDSMNTPHSDIFMGGGGKRRLVKYSSEESCLSTTSFASTSSEPVRIPRNRSRSSRRAPAGTFGGRATVQWKGETRNLLHKAIAAEDLLEEEEDDTEVQEALTDCFFDMEL